MSRADEKMIEIITKAAENGLMPWDSRVIRHMNCSRGISFSTKKPYQGFNALLTTFYTMTYGWDSNQFITFAEIRKQKGHLTEGSRGVSIFIPKECYYHLEKKDWIDGKEYRKIVSDLRKEGREDEIDKIVEVRLSFTPMVVFNLAQTTGIPYEKLPPRGNQEKEETVIDDLLENWVNGPKIERTYYTNSPCYIMGIDTIRIQPKKVFQGNGYEHALAHEMMHATGIKGRCERNMTGGRGSESYAREELVADIGANMLLARCGYSDEELAKEAENTGAYIKSWASAIKSEKNVSRLIQSAYKQAMKGTEYILDNQESEIAFEDDIDQEAV